MGSGDKEDSSGPECKKKLMDLKECITDSPSFRIQLKEREREIADLEARLEKVVSSCDRMVSSGVLYTDSCRVFSVSVKDLSTHFGESEVIAGTLKSFYDILKELQSYYSILFDQAQRSVQSSLRAFLSGELKKVKETKKVFHKVSDELNSCALRNATVPRGKVQECDEASVQLANAQNMFSHHAIDYGYQINTIDCVKGHEILSNLLSYMRAQFTFFHQGYDLLHEFDPFMKQVGTQVDRLRKESADSVKEMDSRHSLVASHHLQDGSPDAPLLPMGNPTLAIENSGYLFKKPRGNSLFKTWSRRWFILKDNKLVYQSESKDEEYSIVAEDMRICTVKFADDLERRFCFEVVTPWRSCMVQANSEALRRKWVTYIEASIARSLRISASNKKMEENNDFKRRSMMVMDNGEPIHMLDDSPRSSRKEKKSSYTMGLQFLDVPGNNKCADCNGENPTWASINLGIMLCIECSGIHRSLGVHISKVRSVTLDDWEPELQRIMCQLGNARVNAIYEFDIPTHVKRPTSESTRSARETYIRLKYVQHAFVHPHPNFERPDVPIPPPTISELLTPSKSPLSFSGGSPKSPTRRSFSPSFKMRSPKVQKVERFRSTSRPSSASSVTNISDQSTPADSEEDLRRTGLTGSTTGSMQLLADNLKKLEKSGKLKNWGSLSISDKIRSSARRSSRKISAYAKSKITGAREKLLSKEKPPGFREVHSDIEDEEMISTSTPLLYSMSASTQNLSTYTTPPPKPPRTFATKRLSSQSTSDDEGDLFKDSGDFSDILSAIKEMGVLYNSKSTSDESSKVDDEEEIGIPNGRIPEMDTTHPKMKKSESSPQLSHTNLQVSDIIVRSISDEPADNGKTSPRLALKTIAEDQSSTLKPEPLEQVDSHLSVSTSSVDLPVEVSESTPNTNTNGERLVSSVPLRRKRLHAPSQPLDCSLGDSSLASSEGDLSNALQASDANRYYDNSSKRYSIMSTTSAEFFSAESSDGSESKPPSTSISPDLRESTSSQLSAHVDMDALRVPSAGSIEDECFSTPPSTPNQLEVPINSLEGSIEVTNDVEEVDHVTEVVKTVFSEISNDEVTTDLTNQNEAQDHVTPDDALITESSPIQSPLSPKEFKVHITSPKSTPTRRKRSLTISDSLPVAGKLSQATSSRSKDDNFETESKRRSNSEPVDAGLISSFSQQDFADIFGRVERSSALKIDPALGQALSIPEENEEDKESNLDIGEDDKEELSSSPSPLPSLRVGTPEGVEAVIIPDTVTPNEFLCSCVLASDLPGVLCALAHGSKINAVAASGEGEKTPILLAIELGNPVLTEYLFQNGAKLNCTDSLGRSCLHYAVLNDQSNLVATILKRGVKPGLKDSDGKDAIAYAVERENGDIVTMLRMATFRAQAEKGSDNRQSQYMEELQSEFFRDIEVATLVDPERSRKSTASDSSSVTSRDS